MFLAGLEEDVEGGPLALACHMSLYAWDVFVEASQEHLLDMMFKIQKDPNWVPNIDPSTLPYHILLGFPFGLKNMEATYSS